MLVDDGSIVHKARAIYPNGFDRVLELIGATTLLDSLQAARRGGIVCMTGIHPRSFKNTSLSSNPVNSSSSLGRPSLSRSSGKRTPRWTRTRPVVRSSWKSSDPFFGSSGISGEGRSDVREQILGRRGAPALRGGPHWARIRMVRCGEGWRRSEKRLVSSNGANEHVHYSPQSPEFCSGRSFTPFTSAPSAVSAVIILPALIVDTRVVVEVQSLQMGASCPWAPPTWSTEAHPSL